MRIMAEVVLTGRRGWRVRSKLLTPVHWAPARADAADPEPGKGDRT